MLQQTLDEQGFLHMTWGNGMADWFVIGGRWSGELSRHSWAKLITEQMDALEREHDVQVWGAFYGDEEKQREQRELAERFQDIWKAAAPCAFRDIPIQRDTYKPDGYEDDAMLLSEELYNDLLQEYADKARASTTSILTAKRCPGDGRPQVARGRGLSHLNDMRILPVIKLAKSCTSWTNGCISTVVSYLTPRSLSSSSLVKSRGTR